MLFRYELLGLAYFPNRLSVLAEMQVLRAWFKYAESSPFFLAKGLEGMTNEEIKSNLKKLFETTIERLNDRLVQVQETLRSMTGGD